MEGGCSWCGEGVAGIEEGVAGVGWKMHWREKLNVILFASVRRSILDAYIYMCTYTYSIVCTCTHMCTCTCVHTHHLCTAYRTV